MVCVAVGTLSTGDVERHRWQCHPGVVGRSPVMKEPPCDPYDDSWQPPQSTFVTVPALRGAAGQFDSWSCVAGVRRPASGGASEVDIFWSPRENAFEFSLRNLNFTRAPARATIVPVRRRRESEGPRRPACAGTAGVMSRAPGGAVLAAAGIAADTRQSMVESSTRAPAQRGARRRSWQARQGSRRRWRAGARCRSWATPVRSHVVVTMMARSITVERSVPALLGLARVSGLGMGVFVVSGLGGGPPRISL